MDPTWYSVNDSIMLMLTSLHETIIIWVEYYYR